MIRTLQITMVIIYVLAIAALMNFVFITNGDTYLDGTNVVVYRNTENGFLKKEVVYDSLLNIQSLDSIMIKNLDISKLEKSIRQNPFVSSADLYVNIEGKLMVNVNEEKPLLRIFNKKSPSFYVNKDGKILPLSNDYSARVYMVNGYLNTPYEPGFNSVYDTIYSNTKLKEILHLANTIEKSEFFKSQINQIYINSRHEYELLPEFGNHTVILGDLSDLDMKLRNLDAFYRQVLLEEGLDKYSAINLKFKNQIVCVKK